jgi:hypothetical protein
VRPRSLLVLTAVVLALGAFVWFWERKQPSTEEAKAEGKKVLAGVEADDVSEVSLTREGTTVRLVREGGVKKKAGEDEGEKGEGDEAAAAFPEASEWRLAAPMTARADRTAVEGLLSSVLGIEKARTLETADRKEYGLAPAAAQVTLTTTEGKRTLEVGRELPGTDQRAVALAGEPAVYVVASSFWNELVKPAGDWRSRELFAGAREDVERVTLQHGTSRVLLARRGGEPWIETPLADRADSERFDQLLDAITSLSATEFLDTPPPPPVDLGLDPPQEVIEVVRKAADGKPAPKAMRIALGNALPRAEDAAEGEAAARYAEVDGQLVAVSAPALAEAGARPPEEWRARNWTAFAVYEVDELVARDGRGPLKLTRDDADWKRGGVKIFYGTVSDLLGAIADAKAERVVDGAEAQRLAAGKPALTLDLVGAGGKKQTLTLWPAGPAGAPARASGRDAALLMPAGLPADLAQKIEAIRKAEPLKETPTPSPAS